MLRQAVGLYHGGVQLGSADAADLLDSLGLVLRRNRKFDEAEKYFREAGERRRELPSVQSAGDPFLAANLGLLAFDRNNMVAAEQFQTQALAIRRQLYGEVHPDVANACEDLGRVLGQEKKSDDGMSMLQTALALNQKLFGANNRTLVGTRLTLAQLCYDARRFAEAEQLLQTNLFFARQLPDHAGLAFYYTIHWLASAQFAQGDYTNAEPLLIEGWNGLQPLADHGRGTDFNYCEGFVQLYTGLHRANDLAL